MTTATSISVIVTGVVSEATRKLVTWELRDLDEYNDGDPDEIFLVLCQPDGRTVTFRSERSLAMTMAVAYAWFGEQGIVAPFAYIDEVA